MHLRSTPIKNSQCFTETVERIRAFVMNGDGNPIVKARCAAVAVFVLLRERDIRDWVGPLESYAFDSCDIRHCPQAGEKTRLSDFGTPIIM